MLRALVIGVCLLVPALSFGQAGRPAPKEIVFTPEGVIEGRLDSPPIDPIVSKDQAKFGNMIQVRQNFGEKVVRSVSEL
jgi:hypothetical protein